MTPMDAVASARTVDVAAVAADASSTTSAVRVRETCRRCHEGLEVALRWPCRIVDNPPCGVAKSKERVGCGALCVSEERLHGALLSGAAPPAAGACMLAARSSACCLLSWLSL